MSTRVAGKLGAKALTAELRKLAEQATTITDDGTPVTRTEQLADLVWKFALGWTEEGEDEEGRPFKKVHPPVPWAMQYLFERMEGKAAQALPEERVGLKAADKVRQLSVDRINALAGVRKGPPGYRPKGV